MRLERTRGRYFRDGDTEETKGDKKGLAPRTLWGGQGDLVPVSSLGIPCTNRGRSSAWMWVWAAQPGLVPLAWPGTSLPTLWPAPRPRPLSGSLAQTLGPAVLTQAWPQLVQKAEASAGGALTSLGPQPLAVVGEESWCIFSPPLPRPPVLGWEGVHPGPQHAPLRGENPGIGAVITKSLYYVHGVGGGFGGGL